MNKDQVNGRIKALEGARKALFGKLNDNLALKAKGKVETVMGQLQATYGDVIANLYKYPINRKEST